MDSGDFYLAWAFGSWIPVCQDSGVYWTLLAAELLQPISPVICLFSCDLPFFPFNLLMQFENLSLCTRCRQVLLKQPRLRVLALTVELRMLSWPLWTWTWTWWQTCSSPTVPRLAWQDPPRTFYRAWGWISLRTQSSLAAEPKLRGFGQDMAGGEMKHRQMGRMWKKRPKVLI